MEIVGVACMASEKVAVIVTTSELVTILSRPVCVKATVGVVESISNFNFSSELNRPPLNKVPLAVTNTSVTLVDWGTLQLYVQTVLEDVEDML